MAGLIVVILAITAGYALTRVNTILSEFKQLFEKRLSSELKLDVRIGSISGGIVRPLVIKNVTIYQAKKVLFKSRRVFIGYKIWDLDRITKSWQGEKPQDLRVVILGGEVYFDGAVALVTDLKGLVAFSSEKITLDNFKGRLASLPVYFSGSIYNLKREPKVSFQLYADNKKIKASLSLTQEFNTPKLDGFVEIADLGAVNFGGEVELTKQSLTIKDFRIESEKEKVALKPQDEEAQVTQRKLSVLFGPADDSKPGANAIKIVAEHVKIGNNDLVTTIDVKTKLVQAGKNNSVLTGEIITSGTVLNYNPFAESECSFRASEKEFEILYYKFGNSARIYGKIGLAAPTELELFLNIDGANLSDMLSFLDEEQREAFLGQINGQVSVKGPLSDLKTKGHLEAGRGRVGDLFFETANINFEGKGPYIKLHDSRLVQEKAAFILEGELDFRNIAKPRFLEGVKIKTEQGLVVWEGWDPSKGYSRRGFSFKDSNNFGFGTYVKEDIVRPESEKGGVEMEYKIRGKESLKMRMQEGEQFFGLEHKVKF